MADVMWNWSERQKEIIIYFREQGGNREAIRLASKNFGVGERSVYKTLKTRKYHLRRDAEKAVADLLNPKWFELEIEPKVVDRGKG